MGESQYGRIVEKLGSQKALVDLAELPQQTVASWRDRGLIPTKHILKILENAARRGVELHPTDFWPQPSDAA